MNTRWWILKQGFLSQVLRRDQSLNLPKSSEVLAQQLRSRSYPHWTAWYVPYCQVKNDLWGQSHFNFQVDGRNYHVLRTGAFPFIKFHCSLRPIENLIVEDYFYRVLKVLNLGIPTLAYGLAGLVYAKHEELVQLDCGRKVIVFFWYKETKNARF